MNVTELIELLKGQPPERRIVLRVSPAECCRTRFHGYRLHEGAILSRERCRPDGSSPGSGSTWPNSIICRGGNSLM
jgi:hypothetical protein